MKAHRSGFTLIELLVVIVIIIILMGIALQVAKTAADRTRRAQTVRTMEALRNALAGFYAAYGQYPPSDANNSTEGTYPGAGVIPPPGDDVLRNGSSQWTNFVGSTFHQGLMYYLMAYTFTPVAAIYENDRNLPSVPHSTEVATAARWSHYLVDVPGIVGGGGAGTNNFSQFAGQGQSVPYTNTGGRALDGWGSSICYSSAPPNQAYRLWSVNMTNGWEE
ncbi:MAG: prepilin-type N-terminal cleavage/methylation domain-containing protein [bacterium]